MRRKITLILAILSLITGAAFAAACGPKTPAACSHEGGTATCIKRAVCDKCGEEYGELNAENHANNEFTYLTNNDGTHKKSHKCCGATVADKEACSGGTATCQKKAVCELCKAEYGELSDHVYDVWKSDADKHWKECACGAKSEEAAHEFTKAGNDADKHWKECVCGAKSEEAAHEFTLSKSDEEKHWKECACGAKSEEAAHVLTDVYDEAQHWKKCDCGYTTNKAAHVLTDAYDEAQHWKKCDCGFATGKVDHEMTDEFDEEKHWKKCDCGYTADKVAHVLTDAYDEAQHWKECACGYESAKSNHELYYEHEAAYHVKKCDCGFASESTAHTYAEWDKTDNKYDYKVCECGEKDATNVFCKKVKLINQELYMTETSFGLNIGGVGEFASIEEIKLGEYSLGTDVTALAVSDALKADTKNHGRQTIIVTVKTDDGETHDIKVPVTIITAKISSAADFRAIQPTPENKGVYGYYVLTSDFSDTTLNNNDRKQTPYAGDWDATTGFFGTLDGRGHTITTAGNGLTGIFGILRKATIKNLTIKDNWRSTGQGCALLAVACYGCTIENVTITLVAGGTQTAVGSGYGWISCAEFSNNTLKNVTVNDEKGYSSLFGDKFFGNTFENVVINGTYAEMGHTAEVKDEAGNVIEPAKPVTYEDVTKAQPEEVEKITLEGRQEFIVNGKISTIDLGEYDEGELLSIRTSTGYELYALSSDLTPATFKNELRAHGEQEFIVSVQLNDKKVEITVPVTVITKEITTMSELQDATKVVSETESKYGYYVLANDVAYNETDFVLVNAKGNFSSGGAFRGVLDGRKHTILTNSSSTVSGLFGTLNGATIKNVIIEDAWKGKGWSVPIIARNAYSTVFESVDITVKGGNVDDGTADHTPFIGHTMQNCTWKKVNVVSAVDIVNVFANQTGNTFKEVTIKANVTGGFSITDANFPTGVEKKS